MRAGGLGVAWDQCALQGSVARNNVLESIIRCFAEYPRPTISIRVLFIVQDIVVGKSEYRQPVLII